MFPEGCDVFLDGCDVFLEDTPSQASKSRVGYGMTTFHMTGQAAVLAGSRAVPKSLEGLVRMNMDIFSEGYDVFLTCFTCIANE